MALVGLLPVLDGQVHDALVAVLPLLRDVVLGSADMVEKVETRKEAKRIQVKFRSV